MPSQELTNKIEQFNRNHRASFSIKDIENNSLRVGIMRDDLAGEARGSKNAQRVRYVFGLMDAIGDIVYNCAQINARGYYEDLDNINLSLIVTEYEGIIQQYHLDKNNGKERKAYEGYTQKSIMRKAVSILSDYNVPLHELWADSIIDKTFSVEQMKAIVQPAINSLANLTEESVDYGARINANVNIGNVLRAKATMERVRQQRGIWWRIRHPIYNSQEKSFLKALNNASAEFVRKGFDVNGILERINQPVFDNVIASYNARINEAQNNNANIKKNHVSVADELNGFITENDFVKNLSSTIMDVFSSKLNVQMPLNYVLLGVVRDVINVAINANEKFDKDVVSGVDEKQAMRDYTKQVFNNVLSHTEALGYTEPKQQLVVAQAITDVIMKQTSPVVIDETKYAEFANGYVLNNAQEFESTINVDAQVIEEARNEFNTLMDREVIDNLGKDLAVNNENVAQVNNEKSIIVEPVINNN